MTQPNHDIGRHAVELLVKALAAGTAPGADASLLLPHAFREGESYAAASA